RPSREWYPPRGGTTCRVAVASPDCVLWMMTTRAQTTMMRVSRRAREDAEALAAATGKPMSVVIEEALAMLRKTAYWQQFKDGVRPLEADSAARAAERADVEVFESTLMDGLRDEEPYPYPGS